MREEVKITRSKLTEQVEQGMKAKGLAEFYGIPVSRMRDILKQAGLRIRSFSGPQVTFVDDTVEEEKVEKKEVQEEAQSPYGPEADMQPAPSAPEVVSENVPVQEEGTSPGAWDLDLEEDSPNLTPKY